MNESTTPFCSAVPTQGLSVIHPNPELSIAMQKTDMADDEEPIGAPAHSTFNDDKWEAMYRRLRAYKQQFGHSQIPYRYEADPQLGRWVSVQRSLYKRIQDGAPAAFSTLTSERIRKLNEIDFEWVARDHRTVPWEDRYQELVEFVRRYGHSQVPIGWEDNVQLATWVSTQRQEYKLLLQGRSTRLTQARMDKLNKLNFIWDAKTRRSAAEQFPGLNGPPHSMARDASSGPVAAQPDRERTKPLIFESISPRSASELKPPPVVSASGDQLRSGIGQVVAPPPGQAIGHGTAVARTHLRPAIFEDNADTPSVSAADRVAQLLRRGDTSSARRSLTQLPIESSMLSQLGLRDSLSFSIPSRSALDVTRIAGIPLNESLAGRQTLLDQQLSRSLPSSTQHLLQDRTLDQARARAAQAAVINSLLDAASQPAPSAGVLHHAILGNTMLPQQVVLESQAPSRSRSRALLEQLVSEGVLSSTELQLLSLLPSEQQLEYATRVLLEANLSRRG